VLSASAIHSLGSPPANAIQSTYEPEHTKKAAEAAIAITIEPLAGLPANHIRGVLTKVACLLFKRDG